MGKVIWNLCVALSKIVDTYKSVSEADQDYEQSYLA